MRISTLAENHVRSNFLGQPMGGDSPPITPPKKAAQPMGSRQCTTRIADRMPMVRPVAHFEIDHYLVQAVLRGIFCFRAELPVVRIATAVPNASVYILGKLCSDECEVQTGSYSLEE